MHLLSATLLPRLARRPSHTAHKPTHKMLLASDLGTKHPKVSAKPFHTAQQIAILSRMVQNLSPKSTAISISSFGKGILRQKVTQVPPCFRNTGQ